LNIPPVEAGIRTSEAKICTFSGIAAQWFCKSLHPFKGMRSLTVAGTVWWLYKERQFPV